MNTAFYEAQGIHGWISLQKTVEYLKKNYPECFAIADAKRGDIGNTSAKYAKTFFELLPFDAVTVAPYMGYDSVEPFLAYKNKWTILLGITSNAGSKDFQILATEEGLLYEVVIKKAMRWAGPEKLMFVAGATQPDIIKQIRNLAKEYFLLIPGVGAQGGSVEEVCVNGINHFGGIFINSSRQIIYASQENGFEQHVRQAAFSLQQKMQKFIC
ncbi:MAG: orotidine-5'-phosphate decarboxylase [Chitinophagales bacterium]|nr:orotidine-5'-phosphate decarboxylase [Chitinophagales bacterium]